MSEPRSIFVDERWKGAHGIGRYASEVISRLPAGWRSLNAEGKASSPKDALRRIPAEARGNVIYSPSYNASIFRSATQLITIHDLIHLEVSGPKRVAYQAYYAGVLRPAVRRARMVLTVSETSKELITEWVNDDRVEVINAGNAVSDAFQPDGPSHRAPRPYVLYVGNLREHKNVDVLLRALTTSELDAVLVLPAREAVEARSKIDAMNLHDRVQVISGVDDPALAEYYRGAAVTAMPSTIEGFGLPALESLSSGTPVVYWSGCASVAEIVGQDGVAVGSAHDGAEWSRALEAAGRLTLDRSNTTDRPRWDDVAARVASALDVVRAR